MLIQNEEPRQNGSIAENKEKLYDWTVRGSYGAVHVGADVVGSQSEGAEDHLVGEYEEPGGDFDSSIDEIEAGFPLDDVISRMLEYGNSCKYIYVYYYLIASLVLRSICVSLPLKSHDVRRQNINAITDDESVKNALTAYMHGPAHLHPIIILNCFQIYTYTFVVQKLF